MHTYEQIISDLKKKIYKPIYYLMGEESYFIDEITNYIEKNILDESEKAFNQTIFYGRDIDLHTLINTAKQFPMGANYNVIIVKEAQTMKGIEGMPSGNKDPFLTYVENPLESTILVINLRDKKLDKRKKIYKTLDKNACLFESKKIYDNKVGAWVTNYIKKLGFSIKPKASELIAGYLGSDLSKVANELKKLTLTHPKEQSINTKDIEDNIGISKEFNVFELQNAIGKRNITQAMLIATNMSKNPKTKSIIPIISLLYSYFSKIIITHYTTDKSNNTLASTLGVNPFFVKDYLEASRNFPKAKAVKVIGILRHYDTLSKGINSTNIDDEELIKEMVFAILAI